MLVKGEGLDFGIEGSPDSCAGEEVEVSAAGSPASSLQLQ